MLQSARAEQERASVMMCPRLQSTACVSSLAQDTCACHACSDMLAALLQDAARLTQPIACRASVLPPHKLPSRLLWWLARPRLLLWRLAAHRTVHTASASPWRLRHTVLHPSTPLSPCAEATSWIKHDSGCILVSALSSDVRKTQRCRQMQFLYDLSASLSCGNSGITMRKKTLCIKSGCCPSTTNRRSGVVA